MWQELRKTYDNDSKTIWIVNVGDIKPAEVCIDFWSRLAWNPTAWEPDAQDKFLTGFDEQTFGSAAASVHELQTEYYRLADIRKPEHIDYKWIDSLSTSELDRMVKAYTALLAQEKTVAATVPADRADAYFETVGYAARMLGATGLLYAGDDATAKQWKRYIDDQTDYYNNKLAGGKWHLMMNTTPNGVIWPEAVGGKAKPVARTAHPADVGSFQSIDAAALMKQSAGENARWQPVAGLGWSARAMSLQPATPASNWDVNHLETSPSLEYEFTTKTTGDTLRIHALPTMRLTPDGHLRIAISIDGNPPQPADIPGGEASDENSKARSSGVLANRVTITVPLEKLPAGKHSLKIYAVDPGVVVDQIDVPE
jgi:hypothetical protein